MRKFKTGTIILLWVLCLGIVSGSFAQDFDAVITPQDAEIETGAAQQFEAFVFSINDSAVQPISADQIEWSIIGRPHNMKGGSDSLATISPDGFFVAGNHTGLTKVRVQITKGGRVIEKITHIRVGESRKHFFDVKVVPQRSILPSGKEQQFRVVVKREDIVVPPKFVHWEVSSNRLGKIDENGLFKAGDRPGRGQVVASVEVDGLRLSANADVIVSPEATGFIAGKITNSTDLTAITDARVRAVRLGSIHWVQKANSDSAGNYFLTGLLPGAYVITATAADFVGEFYNDTRNYLEATPLSIAQNDTVEGIDFGLAEGGKITGVVFGGDGSTPLPRAYVTATLVVNERMVEYARSNEDGSYVINGLPTGSYHLAANANGYRGEYYDDTIEKSAAQLVAVNETVTTSGIDFDLAMSGAIQGVVTSSLDQSPLRGAYVVLYGTSKRNEHAQRPLLETRTNENGKYLLQARPGSYIIYAIANNFNGEFYDGKFDRASADTVVVAGDVHTTNIDFSLSPSSSIAGNVTDERTGAPIAGAVVEAFREKRLVGRDLTDAGFRARTDSLGNYLIKSIPVGAYMIKAFTENYLPEFYDGKSDKADADVITVGESQQIENINFTLGGGGGFSGFVKTEKDSLPIPRAMVRAFYGNTGRNIVAYTDGDGKFEFGGLLSGKYYIRTIAKGYFSELYDDANDRSDATVVEVVAPNVTPDINFYLKEHRDKDGTIVGRVYAEADTTPVRGAMIVAVSPSRRRPHITFTGEDGSYRLTNLSKGQYYVFAWAEDFVGEFFDDVERFRDATPVIVQENQISTASFGLMAATQRGLYAIRGKIDRKSDRQPVAGVLVHARIDGQVDVNGVTDSQGNYYITGLAAGQYTIEASGAGYEDAYYGGASEVSSIVVSVGDGQDASSVNLQMSIDNITTVSGSADNAPKSFSLEQNYPNPFNPATNISYTIAENGEVNLRIFNLLGQEVRTLVSKVQPVGSYTVKWNGKDMAGRQVATGIYIFRLKAGDNFQATGRMLLLK